VLIVALLIPKIILLKYAECNYLLAKLLLVLSSYILIIFPYVLKTACNVKQISHLIVTEV